MGHATLASNGRVVPERPRRVDVHRGILYSYGVLTDVSYGPGEVRYTARDAQGTEHLRLSYLPSKVTLNEASLDRQTDSSAAGWSSRELGGGDHAVTIRHSRRGQVRIANE